MQAIRISWRLLLVRMSTVVPDAPSSKDLPARAKATGAHSNECHGVQFK
jgi:hypothetical protein